MAGFEAGCSASNAIVLSDSDDSTGSDDANVEDTCTPVPVRGSPLKILPRQKYRRFVKLMEDSDSDSDDEDDQVLLEDDYEMPAKARKKLKFSVSPTDSNGQPVFETPPPKYSAEKILKILLDPRIDKTKICKHKPLQIRESATFVVDVRCLKHQDDIKKDEFGIWHYSGSHPQTYRVYIESDGHMTVEKCGDGASGSSVVYLRRLHCTHPSNSEFKRLICLVSDSDNNPHHLCLLVYRLPPGFTPRLSSHGNSVEKKPFFATWPSTITKIKQKMSEKGPRATLESISREIGGVLGATASGELPRDEKQVSNTKRRSKFVDSTTSDTVADELFVVMQRAYAQDPMNKFIRDIKTAPEPAIIIANDQQLTDLVRFCTSSVEFGVLTVDPTFCLGDFDVTPITYRHLLLETRRNNQPPVFLGPILVHYRKTFASYLFFASSLIGQNRQLEGIRAIGTDGEQPLIDAFLHEFGFAQHLTCFIHVRRNVKEKLAECSIPHELATTILNDIFGQRLGAVFQEGLVDCDNNDDFESKSEILIETWRTSKMSSASDIDKFIKWFVSNKIGVIRNSMLRSIREESGLGNPPPIFTTNASESINALIKRKMDYKKHQLPQFIEMVHELVDEQNREVERAIVNRGKWRLRSQYQFLEVQESVWFTMSIQQRQKHLSKVHSALVSDVQASGLEKSSSAVGSSDSGSTVSAVDDLSVDAATVAKDCNLPLTCVEGIFRKAKELLRKENAIVPAPGQSSEARMVLSYTNKVPHMVTPTKGGVFSCESNCPNWKSIGICSHSVAVAHVNGKLQEFTLAVKKKKRSPNVTALVTSTMPRGRGRKGGVPPRTRKQLNAEASTRVAMNIGTQVVSNVHGSGSASCVTQSTPLNTFQAAPYFTSPTASMAYPFSPNIPPAQGYDPWNMHPHMYSYPTAYPYAPGGTADTNPFCLCFIRGNISVCIGCKNRYEKSPRPPNDLCIKHQEWREFTPVGSETPQSKFSNVYYHCKPQCVWLRCADFNPSLLDTSAVVEQLSSIHKEFLANQFGIFLD